MNETEKKDEEFMRKALAEAQAAFDEDEIPVGAVIVCQGRIMPYWSSAALLRSYACCAA